MLIFYIWVICSSWQGGNMGYKWNGDVCICYQLVHEYVRGGVRSEWKIFRKTNITKAKPNFLVCRANGKGVKLQMYHFLFCLALFFFSLRLLVCVTLFLPEGVLVATFNCHPFPARRRTSGRLHGEVFCHPFPARRRTSGCLHGEVFCHRFPARRRTNGRLAWRAFMGL